MEPAGEEECRSSESGWTMYIGSPIDDDDDDDEDDDVDYCYDHEGTEVDIAEVESDDSMASDASSGPSHYGINNNINIKQKVEEEFDDVEEEEEEYYSDHKKENQNGEKKQRVLINSKEKDSVQGKVRKNQWVGTRK